MNPCNRFWAPLVMAPLMVSCAAAELYGLEGKVLTQIEQRSVIALWPNGTAGINPDIPEEFKPGGKKCFNIHHPNLTVYKPTKANGVALVVCAGGGYRFVSTGVEGGPVAERLTQSGITVFVLKYRLPTTPGTNFLHPVPLSDALRAIQLVRGNAAELGIDPHKIGIMGFSAGGHLASAAGTLCSKYSFGDDRISKNSSRPDFMCLIYPAITTKPEIGHACLKTLIAPRADPQTQALLSNELNVTRETPPTFLVHAKDDKNVKYENSVVMNEALQKQGVPSELKLYAEGGHGFGLGRKGTDSEQWTDDFVAWLHKMKFIPPVESNHARCR